MALRKSTARVATVLAKKPKGVPVATSKVDITAELEAATKALAPALKRLTKAVAALDPAGMPVGSLADLLYDLRLLGKQLKAPTAAFDDLLAPVLKLVEEHFIQTLSVGESSGVQGKKSRVQVTDSVVPTVVDWEKFYAHIKKKGEFELLNKAVNRAAVQERWDAHKELPGVGKLHIKKVSCTKLSGK